MSEEPELGIRGWLSGSKSKKSSKGSSQDLVSLDKLRLAVLPMANLSPDPNDSYFADGITEEIISTLSSVRGLSVISRTSVMGYKETTKKLREIGKELEVGSILESTFRKSGKKIRITTQLIDVVEDKHLWAQSYDRELDDVFAIQTDIAKQVTDALKIRIFPEEKQRIEKPATKSTEALSLYLKGKYWLNKRTEEGMKRAIKYFQEAAEADPNYPLAYIGISDAYTILVGHGYLGEVEGRSKAEQNVAKALALDDQSSEAHTSLGDIYQLKWDWSRSEAEFRRAIELNPNYATAHLWYSNLLANLGRLDEALGEAKKALKLDPLSPIILSNEGVVYLLMGDYNEAISRLKEVLEMDANFVPALLQLAGAYVQTSRTDFLMALWPKLQEVVGEGSPAFPRFRAVWASWYAWLRKQDEARRLLHEAKLERDKVYVSPSSIAAAHLYLGEKDEAFRWLEVAYKERDNGVSDLKVRLEFKSIRSDPRFQDLLRKTGLGN